MRLHQLLGTEFPIIQGGMANIATGRFAAACSNAGAMGIVAAGGLPPEVFREEIRLCRSLTDKPFGVNIMLMHPEVQTIAQIAAEEKVPFITSGAGNPAPFIPAWKEAGAMVFPVVAAVAVARIAARAGADGVIAEGMESGGHIGEATTMALVPAWWTRWIFPLSPPAASPRGGRCSPPLRWAPAVCRSAPAC